jgi:hypothetical protein
MGIGRTEWDGDQIARIKAYVDMLEVQLQLDDVLHNVPDGPRKTIAIVRDGLNILMKQVKMREEANTPPEPDPDEEREAQADRDFDENEQRENETSAQEEARGIRVTHGKVIDEWDDEDERDRQEGREGEIC